jgi:hypothetical protein
MRSFSALQALRVVVILYEWLDIPIMKRYYDLGFDHYNLQWHKVGIRGLVNALLNRSGPFVNGNYVVPDLSVHSAVQMNKKLRTFDKTFYFRCVKLLVCDSLKPILSILERYSSLKNVHGKLYLPDHFN